MITNPQPLRTESLPPRDDAERLLGLWRAGLALQMDEADILGIEALLGRLAILDRRWPASRTDPADAVALALLLLGRHGPDAPTTRIAMSALLLHARRGNPTAALVLWHAQRQAAQVS